MAQRRHGVDLAHRRCAGLPNGLISFGLSARPNNHVQHSLGRYSSRRSHHVPVAPVYRYGGSHRCARHCSQCNHLHSRERGHDPIAALRRAQPDHAGGGEERQTQPADVRGFRAELPFLARADAIVRATRRSGLRHLYPEWKWGARATHGKPHQPRPDPGSRHQAHRRARVQSGRREARWRGSRHYWRRPMEAPFCLGPSPRRPNDFPGWIAHDDRRDRSGKPETDRRRRYIYAVDDRPQQGTPSEPRNHRLREAQARGHSATGPYPRLRQYIAYLQLQRTEIRWAAFTGTPKIDQPSRIRPLQVADLAAGAHGSALRPDRYGAYEAGYLLELAPRIYVRGNANVMSYGFNIVGSPSHVKTYPWWPDFEAAIRASQAKRGAGPA